MTNTDMRNFWKVQGMAGLKPWGMDSEAWMAFEDKVMPRNIYLFYTVTPAESPSGAWLHTQEAAVFRLRQAYPASVPDHVWREYQARWAAFKKPADSKASGPQLSLFGEVAYQFKRVGETANKND